MIHSSAIIESGAKLAAGVQVGPYAVIGKNVEIGAGTTVGAHAVIEGNTRIGCDNQIFQFASIGAVPQDKKYHGEETTLEIGDNNVFREFSTANLGTVQGGGVTKIGSGNLFMNYVHIAHDCIVGDDNVLGNCATLAGHVVLGSYVTLSGFVKIAQFRFIGDYSFVVGNADIAKDILPYIIVAGSVDSAKSYGLNLVGLQRHGFKPETLELLKRAYNVIFRQHLTIAQAVVELQTMVPQCPEVQLFIDAINKSEKGILR